MEKICGVVYSREESRERMAQTLRCSESKSGGTDVIKLRVRQQLAPGVGTGKGEYDSNEGRQEPGRYSMLKMNGNHSLNKEHPYEQHNGSEQISGCEYVGWGVCV